MSKKYFILSDIHLEFWQGKEREFAERFPKTEGATVCICAGDLTSFGLPDAVVYKHFSTIIERFDKTIYVPGNHEYYGSSPSSVAIRLAELENYFGFSLTVLRSNNPYVYEGQRFIGDTMWFPDTPGVHVYKRMINDTFQIKNLLPWAFDLSNDFMHYIRKDLHSDDIVITHHVPCDNDTLSQWKNSPTQSYFLNTDCHRYLHNVNSIKPKTWIYGHTHDYHDYQLGNTRFICNPVGYHGENPNWKLRQLVYEL